MIQTLMQHFRILLAVKLLPNRCAETWSVANRKGFRWYLGSRKQIEFTLTVRDLTKPDGYTREELICAQRLVHTEEKRQGWKVPEMEGD